MCNEYKLLGFCARSHPLSCYLASLRGCAVVVIFFKKKSFSNGHNGYFSRTPSRTSVLPNARFAFVLLMDVTVASRVLIGFLLLCGGAHEASDYQTVRNTLCQLPHDCTDCLPDLDALVLADDIPIVLFSPLCLFAIFIRAPGRWSQSSSFSVILISTNNIPWQLLCMLPTYV
jgi:hypothetical protein